MKGRKKGREGRSFDVSGWRDRVAAKTSLWSLVDSYVDVAVGVVVCSASRNQDSGFAGGDRAAEDAGQTAGHRRIAGGAVGSRSEGGCHK
jgi:hypothetical protein